MEFVVNKIEDLDKNLPSNVKRVRINLPNLDSADIVNFVSKYLSCLSARRPAGGQAGRRAGGRIKANISEQSRLQSGLREDRTIQEVWLKSDKFPILLKNGYLIFFSKGGSLSDRWLASLKLWRSGQAGASGGKNHSNEVKTGGKRGLDIFISSLMLGISFPILLVSSILIKLTSKGPVLFRQSRIGVNGKLFNFYKFRTMHCSNPLTDRDIHRNYIKKSILGSNSGQSVSQTLDKTRAANKRVYKLTNDPRITPVGRWLRKLSIDELPQLINVLKGDMSLIGPRPPIPYEVKLYSDWHYVRLIARPGITGLWQVMGRSLIPFNQMVLLDFYYAVNQSFWLDLRIFLRTIPMVLSLKGAY
ncbi:sugar transferase [candidate division WOR-3 bacterium]|nr:sugar transferase [candidate division WOR-3 bacterium]